MKHRMQECKIGALKRSIQLIKFMVHIFVEQFALKSLLHLGVITRLKIKSESAKYILEHFLYLFLCNNIFSRRAY
jgi:hypothetical protein